MRYRFIRNILKRLKCTCLHPQWFVYKRSQGEREKIARIVTGKILDIGCADQSVREHLSPSADYIGLDYYHTATEWYKTEPHVFGDAQQLPFGEECVDSVLLLDVLEHIPEPNSCLSEISRVLKNKGILVLQVPFLYPIHDSPLDFHRWTIYGLTRLAKKNGFVVKEKLLMGKPVETGGLLLNLALCKMMLKWVENRNPALFLSVLLVPVVVLVNITCFLLVLVSPFDKFMPHGYCLILEKNFCNTSSLERSYVEK